MTPPGMADALDPEQIKKLQRELEEAQETLRAIRQGEVDALVVDGPSGPQLFTLKTAEQPYRMLVEQMQEGAVTLTPAGDVLYCNRRFAELVGAASETIVGWPIAPFVAEADRSVLAAALRAGRGKFEGHALAVDGRDVPALFSVGTFVADGVESLCLVVTDLVELLRTRAARAEAEAASQAKDQFLAMLGHELRNPLGAISSAVSVLGQSSATPEHDRRAREVIAHQTEHLSRLVADLLDVTRGTLGKIELVRSAIDVAAAVRRCLSTLDSTQKLGQRAVAVDVEPVWIEADSVRLEQIIMNLLSNSLKFTPLGGSIRVSVRRERHEAVLCVADDGAGISAELLPSVFELFVQGERNLQAGGLGIGLSLVRRLVELHGGHVEAASPGPGQGSTFTVRLPALADAPPASAPSVDAPAGTTHKRILVVEDSADNREMMRILLESSGHEVHEAGDGVSGVELAVQLEPEIILVDIGLPGIDGYQVARQIRSKLQDRSRLIALSGYGQKRDKQLAFDAGFDDHLLKPVDPSRLLAVLSQARGATAR